MRRRSLLTDDIVLPSNASALDVVFYNGKELVIRKQEHWKDDETPIGIVVVPGHHNRYGDNSCGIMSLVGMDYNHPENGIAISSSAQTDNVTMRWGNSGTSLVNSGIFHSTNDTTVTRIPYQTNSSSTECSIDEGYQAVWPYYGDAANPTSAANTNYKNENSYVIATTGHCFADFNGIRNTAAIYVYTKTNAQWTASTVSNATGTTNAPAAACAGRFKTIGTKSFLDVYTGISSNNANYGTPTSTKNNKGFWYLPAEGELCYLPRYRFEINKTILDLNKKYVNVGRQLKTDDTYWSSSQYYGSSVWRINMPSGGIQGNAKTVNRYVRAFMRL